MSELIIITKIENKEKEIMQNKNREKTFIKKD